VTGNKKKNYQTSLSRDRFSKTLPYKNRLASYTFRLLTEWIRPIQIGLHEVCLLTYRPIYFLLCTRIFSMCAGVTYKLFITCYRNMNRKWIANYRVHIKKRSHNTQ